MPYFKKTQNFEHHGWLVIKFLYVNIDFLYPSREVFYFGSLMAKYGSIL